MRDRPSRRLRTVLGRRYDPVAIGEAVVVVLIVVNTTAVVAASVDQIARQYHQLLSVVELVTVGGFSVEFALRLGARVHRRRFADLADPYLGIDLAAVVPFYVGALIGAGGLGSASLIRILRLLKAARYVQAFDVLARVLRRKRTDLLLSLHATGVLLLVAATGVYFAERTAQPDAFSSIPAAMWWAGVTITTVGYGDVYPVTPLGRVLGVVVSFVGVGLAAVPAGIIVSGFLEETGRSPTHCPYCEREIDD